MDLQFPAGGGANGGRLPRRATACVLGGPPGTWRSPARRRPRGRLGNLRLAHALVEPDARVAAECAIIERPLRANVGVKADKRVAAWIGKVQSAVKECLVSRAVLVFHATT